MIHTYNYFMNNNLKLECKAFEYTPATVFNRHTSNASIVGGPPPDPVNDSLLSFLVFELVLCNMNFKGMI